MHQVVLQLMARHENVPGDFGGNAHRVQGDIRCKVLAVFSTVK